MEALIGMRRTRMLMLLGATVLAVLLACYIAGDRPTGLPVYTYSIIATYPHDPEAFTQGLAFAGGYLYEGTGLTGQSSLRQVELETGQAIKDLQLPADLYGEGITILGDRVFQLTWKSHRGFVYDLESFALLGEFSYAGEGWGITHNGSALIMSDGSANLYFIDPETFSLIRQIEVHDDRGPVSRLNELEYIGGEIYANVWLSDRIARISPETGQVTAWIDLTGLSRQEQGVKDANDVLNGIAYDAVNGRLFVTGKRWQQIYQKELIPPRP